MRASTKLNVLILLGCLMLPLTTVFIIQSFPPLAHHESMRVGSVMTKVCKIRRGRSRLESGGGLHDSDSVRNRVLGNSSLENDPLNIPLCNSAETPPKEHDVHTQVQVLEAASSILQSVSIADVCADMRIYLQQALGAASSALQYQPIADGCADTCV